MLTRLKLQLKFGYESHVILKLKPFHLVRPILTQLFKIMQRDKNKYYVLTPFTHMI